LLIKSLADGLTVLKSLPVVNAGVVGKTVGGKVGKVGAGRLSDA
jgi:hypothetical protein